MAEMRPVPVAFLPLDRDRAERYARSHLKEYGDTLCQYGLDVDFQRGGFSVIAPVDCNLDELDTLSPGLFADESTEVEEVLMQHFVIHAGRFQSGAWLSELKQNASDGEVNLGCEWFRYQPSMYATWNGYIWHDWTAAVCLLLRARNAATSNDAVVAFFREFLWGTRIAFFLGKDLERITGIEKGATVLGEALRDAIVCTTSLVLPAYGGETYLVWSAD